MLKPVKCIELKNGQIMSQPDLEIGIPLEEETIKGFLLMKRNGKRISINKDQIASVEMA